MTMRAFSPFVAVDAVILIQSNAWMSFPSFHGIWRYLCSPAAFATTLEMNRNWFSSPKNWQCRGSRGQKRPFCADDLKTLPKRFGVFFSFASCWCQASPRMRWQWITRTKTASHQNTQWPLSWLLNDAAPYLCRLCSWISIQKKRNADSRLTAKWKLPPPQKNCLVDHSLQLSKIKRPLKIWILHEELFEWF